MERLKVIDQEEKDFSSSIKGFEGDGNKIEGSVYSIEGSLKSIQGLFVNSDLRGSSINFQIHGVDVGGLDHSKIGSNFDGLTKKLFKDFSLISNNDLNLNVPIPSNLAVPELPCNVINDSNILFEESSSLVGDEKKEKLAFIRKKLELFAYEGYTSIQSYLGVCFFVGLFGNIDYIQAAKWIIPAAKKDYSYAQYMFGIMLCNGSGVKKDLNEGYKYLLLSSEQGFRESMISLGTLFYNGWGAPQDQFEAFKWFHRAAMKGSLRAQHTVGVMYLKGDGINQDPFAGCFWILSAASKGYKHSIDAIPLLRSVISKNDFEKANRRIEIFEGFWEGENSKNDLFSTKDNLDG